MPSGSREHSGPHLNAAYEDEEADTELNEYRNPLNEVGYVEEMPIAKQGYWPEWQKNCLMSSNTMLVLGIVFLLVLVVGVGLLIVNADSNMRDQSARDTSMLINLGGLVGQIEVQQANCALVYLCNHFSPYFLAQFGAPLNCSFNIVPSIDTCPVVTPFNYQRIVKISDAFSAVGPSNSQFGQQLDDLNGQRSSSHVPSSDRRSY